MQRNSFLFALAVVLAFPSVMSAADKRRIRSFNISAQAVVTLISGGIQGHVRRPADVARCLFAGAASGYGFYEAKVLTGHGSTQAGWILANMAGSVAENSAAGKNPVAQFGYSIGPFRARFALIQRLDPSADSYVFIDASEYQTLRLIDAIRRNDRPRFRSGLIAFERDSVYERHGDLITVGLTYGIYPGVWVHAPKGTWPHETIHAVQSLQMDSVEPSLPIFTYHPQPAGGRKRILRFEHLKLGILNLTNDRITGNQRYENRWNEIEAFRLAQGTVPTRTRP